MTVLLVLLGGAAGAPARYVTDLVVQSRHRAPFPWGTFTVNVVGSFVLGVVAAVAAGTPTATLLGTGFCGALTTYSTFGFETVRLVERGQWRPAVTNVVLSVLLGLLAVTLGWALGSAL